MCVKVYTLSDRDTFFHSDRTLQGQLWTPAGFFKLTAAGSMHSQSERHMETVCFLVEHQERHWLNSDGHVTGRAVTSQACGPLFFLLFSFLFFCQKEGQTSQRHDSFKHCAKTGYFSFFFPFFLFLLLLLLLFSILCFWLFIILRLSSHVGWSECSTTDCSAKNVSCFPAFFHLPLLTPPPPLTHTHTRSPSLSHARAHTHTHTHTSTHTRTHAFPPPPPPTYTKH